MQVDRLGGRRWGDGDRCRYSSPENTQEARQQQERPYGLEGTGQAKPDRVQTPPNSEMLACVPLTPTGTAQHRQFDTGSIPPSLGILTPTSGEVNNQIGFYPKLMSMPDVLKLNPPSSRSRKLLCVALRSRPCLASAGPMTRAHGLSRMLIKGSNGDVLPPSVGRPSRQADLHGKLTFSGKLTFRASCRTKLAAPSRCRCSSRQSIAQQPEKSHIRPVTVPGPFDGRRLLLPRGEAGRTARSAVAYVYVDLHCEVWRRVTHSKGDGRCATAMAGTYPAASIDKCSSLVPGDRREHSRHIAV